LRDCIEIFEDTVGIGVIIHSNRDGWSLEHSTVGTIQFFCDKKPIENCFFVRIFSKSDNTDSHLGKKPIRLRFIPIGNKRNAFQ
jgi:hypothetical protein